MSPGLLLLVQGVALLVLCVDLAGEFRVLGGQGRAAILAIIGLAGAGLLLPRARARGRPAGPRIAVALLAAAAAVLGVAGVVERTGAFRIEAEWERGARQRLEGRATLLQEDFAEFLRQLVLPIEQARGDAAGPRDAFDRLARARRLTLLPPERQGFSVYRMDGTLLAWDGNSSPPPRRLIADEDPGLGFGIGGREAIPRLYAVLTPDPGRGDLRWVSEFALRPAEALEPGRAGSGASFDFLPRWDRIAPAHVHLRWAQAEDDLALFFERQGDRHWGRVGRDGASTLSFPLRTLGGDPLAVVTLQDARPADAIDRRGGAIRRAAALLAAALVAAASLVGARGLRRPATRLLVGSGAVWLVRGLLLVGAPAALPGAPLYDVGLYSSSVWGPLSGSPADLFLTAAALLAQAWLLRPCLRDAAVPADPRRRTWRLRLAAAGAGLVAIAGALGLHAFLDRLVVDARLDLTRVDEDAHLLPRLALQAALFFLIAALALLIDALAGVARRNALPAAARPRGARRLVRFIGALPAGWGAAAALFAVTLFYVPFVHHAYGRLRRDFFERDLLPRVVHQAERRAQILQDALAAAGEPEFAAAAHFTEGGDDADQEAGDAAYRMWSLTPIAAHGLASSLQVFDEAGARLGRFAVNLAPMLDVPFHRAAASAGGAPVEVAPRPEASVKKPVLFGSRWIRPPRSRPLLVVMTVAHHYDNLPMLGNATVYLDLFRAPGPARTNPELLRSEPLLAVFSPRLERLYESGGEIPPPGGAALRKLERGGTAWVAGDLGDGPAHIVYASGPEGVFALAHPRLSRAGVVASFLRLLLLNALLAIGLVVLSRALRWAATREPPALPPGTYYGRLVSVFLVSGLIPLLTLAYFVTRFATQEFERDITTSGLSALRVARRVAEDYLDVSTDDGVTDDGAPLDDDVVFWLSRVVRQDLDVYKGADLLATSTRELYASGLLNTRLDGATYRAAYLDRRPFAVAQGRAGTSPYLTMSAPMRVDRAGTIGVLSMPLSAQSRAAARKAEEVEDAILIITSLTILLLAIVGYVVARRVAEPIALLARAARRVAQGDLDVRVSAAGGDETATLVESFNRMAASLREQREDLSRRKDYIEKILRSATTGVVSIDAAGIIATINPAAQSLLAGPRGGPDVGESLLDHLGRDPFLEPLRAALRRALARKTEREAELVLARPNTEKRLRAVFIPFAPEENAPPGRIVLLEDVTEIVRSGRLAAWAEMARRVAHEIKNPLTPIQLSVEHVRRLWSARDPKFEPVLAECLDNIQKQVTVLRQIAFEFSAYARLPQLRAEPTPIAAILDDALKPYATAAPPGVRLERVLPEDLPAVLVDRSVIARAVVNLIENALQAMPGGGSLTVSAEALDGHGDPPTMVRLEVRDTGVGIEPALLPRLFEPYFSTKSGGTGLGLGMARRAVEEQGGTITISSRPGEGTIVTLTLPIARADAPGTGA